MQKYSMTFDELQKLDRQFFLEHPTAQYFERQYVAGEFGGNYIDIESVLVKQIKPGLRIRLPILFATKKKRRSPKIKVKKRIREADQSSRSSRSRSSWKVEKAEPKR